MISPSGRLVAIRSVNKITIWRCLNDLENSKCLFEIPAEMLFNIKMSSWSSNENYLSVIWRAGMDSKEDNIAFIDTMNGCEYFLNYR